MSLKIQPPWSMPTETKKVGKALLKEGNTYRLIGKTIFEIFRIETLRLAVGAILKAERAWGEQQIPPSWESRYGERFVMQRYSEKEWKLYEEEIGPDGQWLLERLEGESATVSRRRRGTMLSRLETVQRV